MNKLFLPIFAVFILLSACGTQPTGKAAKPKNPVAEKQASPTVEIGAKNLSRGAISPDIPSIKVALLVPLSGESANIGKSMVDAASLALYDTYLNAPSDEIRAQIVLFPRDTGNTPRANAEAAKQAVEQGAAFVIGPLFSQSVAAVAPVLKEKNIGMLSFSNNKSVAGSGVYTFGFLPEQQVERVAEYAYLNKYQRVAMLAPNDAYGEKVRDMLSEVYMKNGGVISPAELYAPSATNIDAAVARIAGAYNNTPDDRRFQAIFVADSGNQMKNIVKSLNKNHIDLKKIKFISAGLLADEDIAKIPELQGAWFPSTPEAAYKTFERRFVKTYGYKPSRLASLAYDAAGILARIAMKGEGITQAALVDSDGFLDTANGAVRLTADGKSDRKMTIVEITPSGTKIVDSGARNFSE